MKHFQISDLTLFSTTIFEKKILKLFSYGFFIDLNL